MNKCCICKKEYADSNQEICDCGGGIVTYFDDYHEAWCDEYDSDGF